MIRYHDGYQAEGLTSKDVEMTRLFYPGWWLKATGYFDSKINTGPGVIMFASNPYGGNGWTWLIALLFTAVFSSIVSLTVGYALMNKRVDSRGRVLVQAPRMPFALTPGAIKRRTDYVAIDI